MLVARYLPLHAAVFGTMAFIKQPGWIAGGFGCLLWLAGFLAIRHRAARIVSLVGCIGAAASLFPDVPNHGYVLCFALGIGALFHDELPAERALLDQGFRQLGAIVLFWSGVQKLLAGTWTQGQLLAYEIGQGPRFNGVLGWLVPSAEHQAYRGAGPFLGNTTLVLLSNAIWIMEIALGLALLSSHLRIRRGAALLTIFVILGIEVAARESVFGILMLALLLPAIDLQFRARWLWLLVPIELLAIGGRLSLVPGGFH